MDQLIRQYNLNTNIYQNTRDKLNENFIPQKEKEKEKEKDATSYPSYHNHNHNHMPSNFDPSSRSQLFQSDGEIKTVILKTKIPSKSLETREEGKLSEHTRPNSSMYNNRDKYNACKMSINQNMRSSNFSRGSDNIDPFSVATSAIQANTYVYSNDGSLDDDVSVNSNSKQPPSQIINNPPTKSTIDTVNQLIENVMNNNERLKRLTQIRKTITLENKQYKQRLYGIMLEHNLDCLQDRKSVV